MNSAEISFIRGLIEKVNGEGYNQAFVNIGEYLIVQTDALINREYNINGFSETLFAIEDNFPTHKLIFTCRDGVNLKLSGVEDLIEQLALTRPTNHCFVQSHNITNIPNTTHLPLPVSYNFLYMCYDRLRNYPISSNSFNKKFAGMYSRHDLYRLRLFRHLYTNYADDSILSYRVDPTPYMNFNYLNSYLIDKEWAGRNCPVRFDPLTEEELVGPYDALGTIGNHYEKYFIEIVSETDPNAAEFLTEKTMKNFWLGKPFLLMAGTGALAFLQSLGFRTFAPFIDESYDTIPNSYKRLCAIQNEIDRLSKLTYDELKEIHHNLTTVFEHNRQLVNEQYSNS